MGLSTEALQLLLENIDYSLKKAEKVKSVDPAGMVPIWELRASVILALEGNTSIPELNYSPEECLEGYINFARIVNKLIQTQSAK